MVYAVTDCQNVGINDKANYGCNKVLTGPFAASNEQAHTAGLITREMNAAYLRISIFTTTFLLLPPSSNIQSPSPRARPLWVFHFFMTAVTAFPMAVSLCHSVTLLTGAFVEVSCD